MIVKIHSRGVGRGSGPVEYLLGKDGNRNGATLDRGDPEMVKELIDGSRYASGTPAACCRSMNRTCRGRPRIG